MTTAPVDFVDGGIVKPEIENPSTCEEVGVYAVVNGLIKVITFDRTVHVTEEDMYLRFVTEHVDVLDWSAIETSLGKVILICDVPAVS